MTGDRGTVARRLIQNVAPTESLLRQSSPPWREISQSSTNRFCESPDGKRSRGSATMRQRGMGFFRGDDFGAKCADAMLQTAGWSRSKACYKSGSHTIRCLWYRLAAREEEAVESNFRSSCSLQGSTFRSKPCLKVSIWARA